MNVWNQLNDKSQLFLIAGPCVIESKDLLDEVGEVLKQIQQKYNLPIIFKSSYKKANRSKLTSFTGIGDDKALQILHDAGKKYDLPTTTDVHTSEEATLAGEMIDVLQIPAFLCRQTELLLAAADTNRIVNIKKGQFLSPEAMVFAKNKVTESGNEKVMLTERGTTFGYQDLVVDMRAIPKMQDLNCPVVMDVTHSLQMPNQTTGVTGGQPQYIETIARSAVAAGVNGLFIETHPNPKVAKSDGANMLKLDLLESLIAKMLKIKAVINQL